VIQQTALPDIVELRPRRFGDARGFLVETWSRARYRELGIAVEFAQDNLSFSRPAGTVRGLHFQRPPFAQAKLVTCLAGAILDVAVDLRLGSPSFGRHVALRLSAAEGNQIFVPEGFAHGFCTLEPDTLVAYKLSAPYAPEHESGVRWNDPALGVAWPVRESEATVSDKDRILPLLAELASVFHA
jgi:dTDP-4-dehydrorhamnose 3,5-epimerase